MVHSILRELSVYLRKSASTNLVLHLDADPPNKRRDEAEILTREIGVLFEDLRVVGLGATASYQPTLGSVLSPLTAIEQLRTLRHPPLRDILSGLEGVVRPGEMLRKQLGHTLLFSIFTDASIKSSSADRALVVAHF